MEQGKIVVWAEIIFLLMMLVIVPELWLGDWSVGGAMDVVIEAISLLGFCFILGVCVCVILDLRHRISRIKREHHRVRTGDRRETREMKQQMLREVKTGARGHIPPAIFDGRRDRRMAEKERDLQRKEGRPRFSAHRSERRSRS